MNFSPKNISLFCQAAVANLIEQLLTLNQAIYVNDPEENAVEIQKIAQN